jgi:hypothetical protein
MVSWIPAFVNPLPAVETPVDGPLYTLLVSWLHQTPSLIVTTALILIVLQSVFLFYMFQVNGFFGRNNFLPAIIILLAYSWNADFLTLHALLPASIFIVIALNSIMRMYGKQAAFHQVFTAAFSLGMASLFYIPLTYLLFMVWFTLITYRISSWREYAITVIGYILPFIYYVSGLFWNDNVKTGLVQLSNSLFNLQVPERISAINTFWLSFSAFALMVSMVAVLNVMSDRLINLRRRSWVLFNFSITALIAVFVAGWPIISANYLFVIPISFFVTGSLTLLKRPFWYELLALCYFLVFIAMRLYLVL